MTDIFMYLIVLVGIILGSAMVVVIFVNVMDWIALKCGRAIRSRKRKRNGKL